MIDFEDDFSKYICALSLDKHFLVQPVLGITCGHYICDNCITLLCEQKSKCKICGRKFELNKCSNNSVLKNNDRLNEFLKEFQENIEKILYSYENEFEKSIKIVKDSLKVVHESIENKIEIIKAEIDLRIASLKHELDILNEKFIRELNESKIKLIKDIDKFDIEPYESLLRQLKDDSNSKQNQDSTTLNECKKKLQNLYQINEDIKQVSYHVSFDPNSSEIDSSIIGNIHCQFGNKIDVSKRIKAKNYEIIDSKFRVYDLCLLSNGDLITAAFDQSDIVIYDRNFKVKKIIDKINNQSFKPISLDIEETSKLIYICDFINHKILLIDFDYNYLKSTGSQGNDLFQFNSPSSICYSNNFLYVCDTSNKRLHKLSKKFETDEIINLEFMPSRIKILNSLACIRASNVNSIFFYDLNKLKINWKYDGHNGSINTIKSYFWEYYHLNKIFYCYDENGLLIEELEINLIDLIRDKAFNDSICHTRLIEYHNNKLLLTCHETKKLIIL